MAGEHPSTVNREWEEKTNEYFKVRTRTAKSKLSAYGYAEEWLTRISLQENKIEPITGVSSEGYTGKGQIQSPPGHK